MIIDANWNELNKALLDGDKIKFLRLLDTTITENKHMTLTLKGGSGSGNFSHSGRPGLVGGSGEGNVISRPPLVDTMKQLVKSASGSAYYYAYFIMPDGKLLDCYSKDIQSDIIGNHEDIVIDNPEWFDLHPKKGEFASVTDAINKDIIRVNYSVNGRNAELNIETSDINTNTLRKLQTLYDQDKLGYAKNIVWEGNKSIFIIENTIEEFLSAKYVTDGELKELVAILHIGY